jgi:crotonobetaine/carnitine-CoA ligase
MGGVVTPLLVGHRVALEPEFSASNFARRIGELGVSTVTGVGAHAPLILAQPVSPAERGHQVRAMFFAPCPKPVRQELADRFGVRVTAMLYGQTECVPVTYSPLRDGGNTTNPKSCGRPAPDLDLQIVDDESHPVAVGQTGEIIVRPKSPYALFAGYWRNQEATDKAFAGGWYHTGDAGILEDDGSLTFMDRMKDVIRRRGENISSLEVELAIAALPKIADVAVFAIPSPMIEDEVMATIRLEGGAETTPEELFGMLKTNLPYFTIPRYVDIGGEIPRNALDRIMKSKLKERGVTATTWDFNALGLVVERSERRVSH